ncbi:integrase [Listeria monocytogenes]|nr:integrase [Listeria monocytogenes]EAG6575338.1 integrase [Listeria monocytogenes]EAG7992518.1 integrase [Listeria monocytogenes]EAG9698304.1 integrase [Listeria monocytogenes]EAH1990723.1 integrase [Listeria monocytogenes]
MSSNLRQQNQSKVDAFFTLKTDENTTKFATNATKTTE